jgi:hypothetical protein
MMSVKGQIMVKSAYYKGFIRVLRGQKWFATIPANLARKDLLGVF